MEECLKIEAVGFKKENVFFKIMEQKYINEMFYPNPVLSFQYLATNGVSISSALCPCIVRNPLNFYVRGRDHESDENLMECTLNEYLLIIEAVKEYNLKRSEV